MRQARRVDHGEVLSLLSKERVDFTEVNDDDLAYAAGLREFEAINKWDAQNYRHVARNALRAKDAWDHRLAERQMVALTASNEAVASATKWNIVTAVGTIVAAFAAVGALLLGGGGGDDLEVPVPLPVEVVTTTEP